MKFPVTTLPEFWDSMVKGSAPLQMLKKGMGETVWREKEILALDYLKERLPELPAELTSDAWLGGGSEMTENVRRHKKPPLAI